MKWQDGVDVIAYCQKSNRRPGVPGAAAFANHRIELECALFSKVVCLCVCNSHRKGAVTDAGDRVTDRIELSPLHEAGK